MTSRRIKEFPAKYTGSIVEKFRDLVDKYGADGDYILDPMAGVGGIHKLYEICTTRVRTCGIELEQEWADCHPNTEQGSCLELPHNYRGDDWDWIIVSPPYGNRMADSHTPGPNDKSYRNTYRHRLGRPLSEDSGAGLQWGGRYREFHTEAWVEAYRVLKPGGFFVLNIKDHIRKGERQHVTGWHIQALMEIGFIPKEYLRVDVTGNGFGTNGNVRIDYEAVVMFVKPQQ